MAKAFFGLDRAELDFVLDHLNQRYFQPIAQVAETLSVLFQVIARKSNSIPQKIAAAPEIPTYENLLKERCGYGRLGARIMAHQICRWGKNLASEINEGRRVRAIIDEMADAEGRSTLVMSRRAKIFRDECRSVEARDLIEGAIEKANLPLTADQFRELVELACERDEAASRELARMSRRLAPHLPEKRGRRISEDTCTHLFLLRQLASWGHECAFTSSSDGAGFTDRVTEATQLASGHGGFSPLYANKLRKKGVLPPVLRADLLRAERSHAAPPSSRRS